MYHPCRYYIFTGKISKEDLEELFECIEGICVSEVEAFSNHLYLTDYESEGRLEDLETFLESKGYEYQAENDPCYDSCGYQWGFQNGKEEESLPTIEDQVAFVSNSMVNLIKALEGIEGIEDCPRFVDSSNERVREYATKCCAKGSIIPIHTFIKEMLYGQHTRFDFSSKVFEVKGMTKDSLEKYVYDRFNKKG